MARIGTRTTDPWLALCVVALVVAGCASGAAIREFASTSAEAAAYTRLVTQYVESPARAKRYQPATSHPDLDRQHAERRAQQARVLLHHRLIQAYMEALGRLAADDPLAHEIEGLGTAAGDAARLGAEERDAAAALTRVLAHAVADGWRRRHLSRLVADANAPLQEVIASLRTIVERGFADDVANEREAMRRHYRTVTLASRDRAGIAALREWEDVRLAALRSRQAAIAAYASILDTMARGHQRLYQGRDALSAAPLLADLGGASRDMRRLFAIVRDGG